MPAFLRSRELPPPDATGPLDVALADAMAARMRSWDVMRLPVVVGIRTLLADTAAMLPLVAVRGTERLDPQPAILRRPDPDTPYRQTIEQIVNSCTRHGNAFLRRWQVGSDGWPIAVKVLRVPDLTVKLDAWQEIAGYDYRGRSLSTAQVLHVPYVLDGGALGASPIDLIATVVDDLATAYEWAASYWRDGGVPTYALTHPNQYDDTQAKSILDRWIANRQARRPSLLSGGWGLQTYAAPTAADALLIDGLNYLDAAIARAMNVPPSLPNVVSQSALTYATTVDEMRRWLILSLYPSILNRLEAAFTDLLPRGQTAAVDTSNLLRTDWPTRVTTGAAAVDAGLMSVAEVRVGQLGLPPDVTGGDLETTSPIVEGI